MSMPFRRFGRWWWPLLILGAVTACSTVPPEETAVSASQPAAAPPVAPAVTPIATAVVRGRARWVPVEWSALPAWESDHLLELWPALLRGCDKPAPEWVRWCSDARQFHATSDAAVRAWMQQRMLPYRVEALDGVADGVATGYFEPLIEASRVRRGAFRVPLYLTPDDLSVRKPYWTRQQVDTSSAAQSKLRGRELAFVADPLDALILQIQGSGRLDLIERDGSRKLVRAAFAAHNDQPYKSVGRWLVEQGELRPEQASWPAIKAWARMNPKRLNELLWSNPRVVFFREEALSDPAVGPRGGQGVPLTPGRSVAVDTHCIPYGTPLWLDTTEPLSDTALRRAVVAQDTGTAITGAVRIDYFWGWGEQAEAQAGRMKQPLRVWALWPRS